MVVVAGLAMLGMTATMAGAQTVEVKKKPPLYRYVSYWTIPRAHWGQVGKDNAIGNQKILAPALADGTLLGCGEDENQVHSAEGFTHDNWWQANSLAGLMKVHEAFDKGGGSGSPLRVSSTKHWDQMYVSSFYNWKAGSWKGAYGYKATYKLRPDAPDPDDAIRTLSSFYVPVFEKMLADGIIVEYEISREMIHIADSRAQVVYNFVMPSAEGLDKFRAALGDALDKNSLIGPAFGSMMVIFTPQADFLRVNAAYK
ncbi:MAG TPA: hypothetical protein VHW69_08980 [Rhizomicrobium sp.]|jgi:hypothetical protein|nr:hypothetical protein [Rhizomicrobium sp.]